MNHSYDLSLNFIKVDLYFDKECALSRHFYLKIVQVLRMLEITSILLKELKISSQFG